MNMDSIIHKSIFNIQPQNRNNILVGYLINDYLSVVVLLQCNMSKRYIILNEMQWKKLTTEDTFSVIFEAMGNEHNSKRLKIDDDFYYKINVKTQALHLYFKNNYIVLSRNNFYCLKLRCECVNASIVEKNNKLNTYQTYFDNIFSIIKNEISYLPPSCIRKDFISSYIQDYKFNLAESTDEVRSFTAELQQIHHDQLADLLVK